MSKRRIYVCRPNGAKYAMLNGVDDDTISYTQNGKDFDSLEFTIDRFIYDSECNEIESTCYDDLHAYLNLYYDGIGYFQMQEPTVENDGYKETKQIKAYSKEKELAGKKLTGLKFNKGTKDSMEYLATDNIGDDGYAKKYCYIDSDNPELSILRIVLSKATGWSVGHVDETLLTKRISVEADDVNIYGFLTDIVAPKLRCVFDFDIQNLVVNVYDVDTVGEDANIYIGLNKLMKTVDIDSDEDAIITRYAVLGDDELDIRNVNFGERTILNLDYFKKEPYMDQSLVENLHDWEQTREEKRPEYIQTSKDIADLGAKISEINLRVPDDGCYYEQWDEMTLESLNKNLTYYNATLTALRVSVDTNPQYTDPVNKEGYIPWTKTDGTINNEMYLDRLKMRANGYGGYWTYFEILNYIIPNIQTAIDNYGKTEENKKDYVKEYETNWDLYGIVELKAKKDMYENLILKDALDKYTKKWSELTPTEKASFSNNEANYNTYHDKYVEINTLLNDPTSGLNVKLQALEDEVADLEAERDSVTATRTQIVEDVAITNPVFGFTEEQLKTIDALTYEDTYSNNNIFTTSYDDTLSTIDVQEALYQDAVIKLSEVAQPQYSFTTDIENLFDLEEFQYVESDFKIWNYFRVEIRPGVSTKLRMISKTWNPSVPGSNLTVEYTNMITSKSGRTDLTDILNEGNNGSGSSSSSGGSSSSNDLERATEIMRLLSKCSAFSTHVVEASGTANISDGKVNSLIANYLYSAQIDVGNIIGDAGSFKTFFTSNLTAGAIKSQNYKDNNVPILDDYGEINNAYKVLEGIIFDLDNKLLKTPQLEIGSNYIKNNGWILNGTLEESFKGTGKGTGVEYSSICNGFTNWLNATASFVSGTNNHVTKNSEPMTKYIGREDAIAGSFNISNITVNGTSPVVATFKLSKPVGNGLTSSNCYSHITIKVSQSIAYASTGNDATADANNGERSFTANIKELEMASKVSTDTTAISFSWDNTTTFDNMTRVYDFYDPSSGISERVTVPLNSSHVFELLRGNTVTITTNGYVFTYNLTGYRLDIYKASAFLTNIALIGRNLKTSYTDQIILGRYNEVDRDILFGVGNGEDDNNRHNALWVSKEDGYTWCNALRLTNESGYGIMQKAGDNSMKTLITIGGSQMKDYYICNSTPVDSTCNLTMGNNSLNEARINAQAVVIGNRLVLKNNKYLQGRDPSGNEKHLISVGSNGAIYIATDTPYKPSGGNYVHMTIGNELLTAIYLNASRLRLGASGHYVDIGTGYLRPQQSGVNLGQSAAANRFKNLYLSGSAYAGGGSTALTSDWKLKHNIKPIEHSEEVIYGFNAVSFNYNYDYDEIDHVGTIAQWEESRFAAMGYTNNAIVCKIQEDENKDIEDCLDSEITYALRYEEYLPHVIKVVQLQKEQLDKQQEEIDILKEENIALKERMDKIENC